MSPTTPIHNTHTMAPCIMASFVKKSSRFGIDLRTHMQPQGTGMLTFYQEEVVEMPEQREALESLNSITLPPPGAYQGLVWGSPNSPPPAEKGRGVVSLGTGGGKIFFRQVLLPC
jgi:hypothetical protein